MPRTPVPSPEDLRDAHRALEAARELRDHARRALRTAPGEAPPPAAAALARAERDLADAEAHVARMRDTMARRTGDAEKAWGGH